MANDQNNQGFVEAVKAFINRFSEIAKDANVGRAIGLVDSKDWVIADLHNKISDLQKEKAALEKKQDEQVDDGGVEETKKEDKKKK